MTEKKRGKNAKNAFLPNAGFEGEILHGCGFSRKNYTVPLTVSTAKPGFTVTAPVCGSRE